MSTRSDFRQACRSTTISVFGDPERGESYLWHSSGNPGLYRFVPPRSRPPVLTGTTRGILKKFFLELFPPCLLSKKSRNTNEPVGPG